MKDKKEKKSVTGKNYGPYSCEELSEIIHGGEQLDFNRFVGFLILVTAFVGELEDRLENKPIQEWVEDEKTKLRSLMYKRNHQDCFRWFRPSVLMVAQQCKETIDQLRSMSPDKEAVNLAIDELQRIHDAILPENGDSAS